MPRDNQDEKTVKTTVGRAYPGEVAPPITTPEAVAKAQVKASVYAKKQDAVAIHVYFVARQIDNLILQASMLAYTDVRVATVEDFDEIFAAHHAVTDHHSMEARSS
jgi:hypothetical protein